MTAAEPAGQAEPRPETRNGWAVLFVLAVWAGMLLAAVWFVGTYSTSVPFWPDEWEHTPILSGNPPFTISWLWQPWLEHRMPLPKLLWFGLLKITDGDFRAVMFGNALALGALALGLILAARKLRGWTSCTDAFFPLVLLHWGHWENLLWAWQIQFIASTVLAGALLMIIVRSGAPRGWLSTFLAGACLILLALCGANGLVLVPGLAGWLIYSGILRRRRSAGWAGTRDALLACAFAAAALAIVVLYVIAYKKPAERPPGHGLRETLTGATQFLGGAIGQPWQPYSGFGIVALLLVSVAWLVFAGCRLPYERLRALGLFLFLAGLAGLALGIGWSRQEIYSRYVTLAAPALCCVYFIAGIYGGRVFAAWTQIGLLALLTAALPFNLQYGAEEASNRHKVLAAFEQDVLAGKWLHEVAADHYRQVMWSVGGVSREQEFSHYLIMLNEAGFGAFGRLQRDQAAEEALFTEMRPKDIKYRNMIPHIRQVVGAQLPAKAAVAVACHGEDELLQLGERPSWHYPMAPDGSYDKSKP
jgi:hypothetical protein